MNSVEIKEKISRMSPNERDDILLYIEALRGEDDFELTKEMKAELDRRIAHHKANPESGIPARELIRQWREKINRT